MNMFKDKKLNNIDLVDSIYNGLSLNAKANNVFDNFTFVNQDI